MPTEPLGRERAAPAADQRARGEEDEEPEGYQEAVQDDELLHTLVRHIRALVHDIVWHRRRGGGWCCGAGRGAQASISTSGGCGDPNEVLAEVEVEVADTLVPGDVRGGVLVGPVRGVGEDKRLDGARTGQERAVGGHFEGEGRRARGVLPLYIHDDEKIPNCRYSGLTRD